MDEIPLRAHEMTQALKSGGLRMTPQRLEIIREIAKAKDHPDADVILARVRERVPMLSRDTVYRTMDALVDAGLINKILMPRATRFDPDRLPHHHFICERCGKIVDIDADTVSPLPSVPRMLDGIGDVRAVHVHIQGVCHRCSEGHTQDQKRARS